MTKRSTEWERLRAGFKKRRLEFASTLAISQKEEVAQKWLRDYVRREDVSASLAADSDLNACLSDVSIGIELIKIIWEIGLENREYCFLGVVIEDYLSQHGDAAIENIEMLARSDPGIIEALKFVYRNTMSDGVFRRVCALSGSENA